MSLVQLGRYQLMGKLAFGGMAEIYLAKLQGVEGFEKEVVIKRILPQWASNRDFISMLVDEAKIAVQLNHPNIVQVYELAREQETYFIAMELVSGIDLRKLMRETAHQKKKIPLEVVLFIICEVLEGLEYAHSKRKGDGTPIDIIHRDISPQNVLISYDGQVKVTDFGIAKAASRSQETVSGVLKGKFAYMSPEQASQETLDKRTDLFSVGVVLYELLTGERLFSRETEIDTLDQVREGRFHFSPEGENLLPDSLKEIVYKILSKDRDKRYPDAHSFKEAILSFAQESQLKLKAASLVSFLKALYGTEITSPRPPAILMEETKWIGTEPQQPPNRRHLPSLWKVGSVLLVTLLVVAIALFQTLRSHPVVVQKAEEITKPATENKKKVFIKTKENGFLSVQAIPWGYVRIDGKERRWETPVKRLPLAAGGHTVNILYEPDGTVLVSKVKIESSRETICIGDFREAKTIQCDLL